MKEEILKVITMVQEGKIDSEKASELIAVLNEKETTASHNPSSDYLDKTLKIRVSSEEGDNVKVNLPVRLIKVGLRTGLSIAEKIPESAKYIKDINSQDIELILEAIENEMTGQIVEVTSPNGENVSVIIE
ncbi:hypothetical protein JOD43_003529 [Pullulanibacillus pueri]|uniref:YvlB/LiaX N-terminal domain-containing protein n=1 Tax=Pullulanibacillus pueri TaxID=1437324 RepID=A0A8J2ZZI5_9BACL|nr:hypothetical protein [Pullulanibacillus pueri]MBM7683349.1 hypothetical protein [Pullulanibacillus pueri]GGH86638.1 hypothetical protein GCM10007096_34810 [Pullulanibacillus pueri]